MNFNPIYAIRIQILKKKYIYFFDSDLVWRIQLTIIIG